MQTHIFWQKKKKKAELVERGKRSRESDSEKTAKYRTERSTFWLKPQKKREKKLQRKRWIERGLS